jgi:Integrase core domain
MLTADSNKKFVLCITDAFTKYAVVTSIQNKNAETVADAIFKEWFCKLGIPAQIHTDGGKEFVNKLSAEMMELMNVAHTKTSPAHPQCNSQVEVFNKTVKKYLASFVDDTALYWETFLPALVLSYNTSYHSTIATTPFELLFGEKARLPLFPNEDIQKVHYGETSAAERFNLLQKLRKLAHDNATTNGKKQKNNMTKILCRTILKLVIKCSSQMILIPQKTLNWYQIGKALAKSLTLMTLTQKLNSKTK